MNEKETLVEFTEEGYKADPSRLRHVDGSKPVDSAILSDGTIAVLWEMRRFVGYWSDEYSCLRLAARTRKVKVWTCARLETLHEVVADDWKKGGHKVHGPFEIEVPCE